MSIRSQNSAPTQTENALPEEPRDAVDAVDAKNNHLVLDFSGLGTQKTPIEKTELRGITLPQLQELVAFIDRHADSEGFLQGWYQTRYRNRDGSWRERKLCHKDTINLYDVVTYVVNPATEEQKCSYVELVAPAGTTSQTPRWFVSHWWGEPVKDFVKALMTHAMVRGLKDTDAYWVCAYANNQHDLGSEIPADPTDSAFFKAMQESEVNALSTHGQNCTSSCRYDI